MKTVLMIDDEQHIRDTFKMILEELNFRPILAENGQAGLDLFVVNKPDLVLVDLHMPVMNGLEFMESMKVYSPDTPIIVVSGSELVSDAVQALKLGAWDFLLKPINDVHIVEIAINKALERDRLIKENKEYKNHLEQMVKLRTAQLESSNQQLIDTRMQIIIRLAKAAEYKDNDTGKHVIRVSHLSELLAKKVGLDDRTTELIKLCSPMHDIGKLGIPDNVLNKEGALTEDEWEIMKGHSEIGYEMLQPLSKLESSLFNSQTGVNSGDSELLQMARKIAMNHHECWDGTGYPTGKKKEEIPIEARIVTLVDIYDALSSKRPYKEAYEEEKCRDIIRNSSGNILDPQLVELFFNNIDEFQAIKAKWAD